MSSRGKTQRRSLKECLKTFLHRQSDHYPHLTEDSHTSPENINVLKLLPSITSLSTLSGFGVTTFDLHQYEVAGQEGRNDAASRLRAMNGSQLTIKPCFATISDFSFSDIQDAYQFQSPISELAEICSLGRPIVPRFSNSSELVRLNSLTSAGSTRSSMNLSQPLTPDSIHFQSPLSQLAHALDVPSLYHHGTSLQASLSTINSLNRSTSILQMKTPILLDALSIATPITAMPNRLRATRSHAERLALSTTGAYQARAQQTRTPNLFEPVEDVTPDSTVIDHARRQLGIHGVNHFESFCVLDAAASGYPVTATSDDLRGVIELGEPFVLKTANIDEAGMDIITGQDTKGDIVVHFIIYSPLVNPNNGRSRFILASLLDITSFIIRSPEVPDLEALSDFSIPDEDELRTPPSKQFRNQPSPQFSRENMMDDGFALDETLDTQLDTQKDDIWLDLATEETQYSLSLSPSSDGHSRSRRTSSSKSSVEDVLDQFLVTLQQLYSDFFLLGASPVDEASFEIWNVSPSLDESCDYVEGVSTHMSNTEKTHFDRMLKRNDAFAMRIEWSKTRSIKLLHCIPLFGRSNVTWICFLVKEGK